MKQFRLGNFRRLHLNLMDAPLTLMAEISFKLNLVVHQIALNLTVKFFIRLKIICSLKVYNYQIKFHFEIYKYFEKIIKLNTRCILFQMLLIHGIQKQSYF